MKRTAVLLLALALALSTVAGCTATPAASSQLPATQLPASTQAATATPAATPEPTPSLAPTASAPGWMEDTSPITFDVYVNLSWFADKWGQGDAMTAYVTKKTGVNVNYITPTGNEQEKMNTLIASGKLPDFTMVDFYTDAYKQVIAAGLVTDILDLANKYDPYFYEAEPASVINWNKTDDGKLWGVPNFAYPPERINDKVPQQSNKTFEVRQDIYEAIGKPDMRTPEGFLAALQAAKEKYPKGEDGQPMIPIGFHEFTATGNPSFQDYLQDFLAVPLEKDGKLYDRMSDPEYIRWLKVFRKANEMGLLSKDIFIDKRDQMEEKIANGRYFAMLYQWTDFQTEQENRFKAKLPIYVPVNGPADSKMDKPMLPGVGDLVGWLETTISTANKDPKRAIRFLSYLCSVEGQKDVWLGPEGTVWEMKDGKETMLPDVRKVFDTDKALWAQKYNCFGNNNWTWNDPYTTAQWADPPQSYKKIFHDWASPYCVSFAAVSGLDPTADSDEGIIQKQIDEDWGTTLPQLIMAKSDTEFDTILQGFMDRRTAAGFDKLQAFREVIFEKNLKKLGK